MKRRYAKAVRDGVGGWEGDPHNNRHLLPRPKLPVQLTFEMHQAALDKAVDEAKLRYLDGLLRNMDEFADFVKERAMILLRKRMMPVPWGTLVAQVWERDSWVCQMCGRPGQEVDHIHERWLGGADCLENLRLLCYVCHRYVKPIPRPDPPFT